MMSILGRFCFRFEVDGGVCVKGREFGWVFKKKGELVQSELICQYVKNKVTVYYECRI